MGGERSGVIGDVDDRRIVRGVEVLLRVFAGHFDETADGKQADFVVCTAVFDAEQARPKANGEFLDTHAAKLCDGEVPELMDHNHHADKDDKGGGRNQKLMHK